MVKKANGTVDKKLDVILEQLDHIQEDIRLVQKVQKDHSGQLDEIDEVLGAVSRAVDKDAVTILEYGRRITRLERTR